MASPSSSRNEQPVVIAGGGIGGLAAALALARKGFKSVVFEQAPQFGEIGAGIQIAPNAWHALDALGVGGLVKKDAVFIERMLMMDGVSGEKIIDIPLDKRFAKRFANPYAVTHRADIHGSLLDGCKALPGMIELRTSTRVTGFDIEGPGVAVRTQSDVIRGAALIGADGARSVVREALIGDAAHLMLQYMAQGAAMAMEDAVCLGLCAERTDGDFEKAFVDYQKTRLARASRVQISANSLIGMIFHVPDGIQRLVRNEIYRGRSPERYYDALEWVFTPPDYVREFKRKPRIKKSRSKR